MQLPNGIAPPTKPRRGEGRINVPQPAGVVEIVPGYNVSVHRWPNWFHRTMTRCLLGWRWRRLTEGERRE